jgi:hypothetical protein
MYVLVQVPELWNESGNVYVYLHPKESGRGPCFKVADHMFSLSGVLNELLVSEMMAGMACDTGYADVAPEAGPVTEGHLYLPLENTDLEHLVAARNLFALLTHQPLVGTPENPTYFSAVLQISGLLRRFAFSSYDGSSFGEAVDAAFDFFADHVGLADVRHSREKTLEALILAEQMKSWNLYNEAFVHAVGKYESLMELKSPLYERISVDTRKRLERAHLDLANRQASLNTRLEAFEFPSLFAGTASSTSMEEYKSVRFKEWRNSYSKMRSFVLSYYKDLFGNWPPRARSRKNAFSQSGLNRECLKILYSDFCALYDLLVDRHALTPRVIGETYDQPEEGGAKDSKDSKDAKESKEKKLGEAQISALRKVLSEFDKSSPPVLPPIPFDVPKMPSMTAIYENFNDLPAKKQAKYSRSIRPHELQLILLKSRNIDTDALQFPFLLAYKDFELKEAKGVSPQDLADQRLGYWLFLYVVLQSLPMLVVDAPGLRYTEGVEDFLCEAPQGNPPWTEEAAEVRKIWYQTADQNIVELSADVVMFSVEGIYMRSHCWLAAKEWEAALDGGAIPPSSHPPPPGPQLADLQTSPLQPPRPAFRDMDPMIHNNSSNPPSRSQSPANSGSPSSSPHLRPSNGSPHLRPRSGSVNDRARQAFRASMAIGLEPLPLPPPAGVHHFDRTSRVLSSGSLASMSMRSRNGSPGPGSPVVGPGSPVSGGPWEGYQLGLRASRSAVHLNGAGGGGGNGEMFLNAAQQQQQPRKSSYGGFPGGPGPSSLGPGAGGHHHGVSDPNGGSTFDDILKGMDSGKKKKKSLFF